MIAALLTLIHAVVPVVDGDRADESDLALLRKAVAGQGAAVRMITRRLNPVIRARVLRTLRRLTPSHLDDTDDVVQKVWLVLLKEQGRQLLAYDPARGISLEAYVGMIAEREVRNHIEFESAGSRRPAAGVAALDEAVQVETPLPSPEQSVVSGDTMARLDAHLMSGLGPKGQAVLRLLYGDGHPPDEVARMLGCTVQVVYNWQHKIRGLARDFLAEVDLAV